MTTASSAADDDPDSRVRQRLCEILDRDGAPPAERIAQVLRLGAERFGVALGLLVRVDAAGDTDAVDQSSADPAEWTEGLTGDLLSTYCRMVVTEEAPLVLETVPAAGGAAHRSTLLSTYIGTTVVQDGAPYGTVCFVDRRARDAAVGDADRAVLAALADGIGRLVEQRDAAAARTKADAGGVVASLDITEPEEQDRQRDERTRAYRALAEHFPDGAVGIYDPDLRYTLAAGTLAGETLPTAEETVGSRVGDLFPDDAVRDLEPLFRAAVEDGTAGSVETTFNGRVWRVWAVPLRNRDDEIFAGLSFAQDITEQKEAERQLRESERRFRRVFENAAIGIVVGDDEGHIRRANPAFESMLGYEENELQGVHFADITHPKDVDLDVDRFAELTEGDRNRYQIEKRYVRKDGAVFWGRLTVSLLDQGAETKFVALVKDIDDQKQYQEQLLRAKEAAEEAARLKTVMLANMSHEVRTPLTSMIGFAGLLKGQLDGHSAKLARLIHKSGQRLEETLEAVLELSQLEAGSYAIEREPVDVAFLARRIVDEFEPQSAAKDLTVDVEGPDDAAVSAYADQSAARRIMSNLLDNAIQFTPAGGRVTIRTRPDGADWVTLAVEDTGVGIAEEALPRVFEAFKQESEGLTREYEGAGLGLSIVNELVDVLGGRIEVDTEKGTGTCFTVRLPRAAENVGG